MTDPEKARALADELEYAPRGYGWSSHRAELGGDLCPRAAAAFRALADRVEAADAEVERLLAQCDEERSARMAAHEHYEKRHRETDKVHRAEIADMRAEVEQLRAALARNGGPDA